MMIDDVDSLYCGKVLSDGRVISMIGEGILKDYCLVRDSRFLGLMWERVDSIAANMCSYASNSSTE